MTSSLKRRPRRLSPVGSNVIFSGSEKVFHWCVTVTPAITATPSVMSVMAKMLQPVERTERILIHSEASTLAHAEVAAFGGRQGRRRGEGDRHDDS